MLTNFPNSYQQISLPVSCVWYLIRDLTLRGLLPEELQLSTKEKKSSQI